MFSTDRNFSWGNRSYERELEALGEIAGGFRGNWRASDSRCWHANSANIGTESSEYERRENIKMSLSDSFERILTERFWLLLAVKSNPSETKNKELTKHQFFGNINLKIFFVHLLKQKPVFRRDTAVSYRKSQHLSEEVQEKAYPPPTEEGRVFWIYLSTQECPRHNR